jgi:hypothetical protein
MLQALDDTVPVQGGQNSSGRAVRSHEDHPPGTLMDSLDYKVRAITGGAEATIGADQEIWGVIEEYGRADKPGGHWMQRAFEGSKEECYRVVKERLEETTAALNQEGK